MAWPSGWSLMTFKKPTSVSWSSRDHSSPPQAQVENQITHLLSAHVCTHIRHTHTHTQTLNFLQDQQEAKEAGKIFRPFPFHPTHLQKILTCFTSNSRKSDSTPIGVQFFLRGGSVGNGQAVDLSLICITLKKLTQGEGLIE